MIRKTIGKFEVADSFSVDYGVLFNIRNAVLIRQFILGMAQSLESISNCVILSV